MGSQRNLSPIREVEESLEEEVDSNQRSAAGDERGIDDAVHHHFINYNFHSYKLVETKET